MIIEPPPVDGATGLVEEYYRDDLDGNGFVSAHTQAMATNPEALAAFERLVSAIVPSIGVRVYELATLGAARAVPSPHCLIGHAQKVLRAELLDEGQLERLARGDDEAFDEADAAVLAFAHRLSTAPDEMTDADALRLRAAGFTDRQIVDIALAAAARNYFSRALQALAVPVEDMPGVSPHLTSVLRGEETAR